MVVAEPNPRLRHQRRNLGDGTPVRRIRRQLVERWCAASAHSRHSSGSLRIRRHFQSFRHLDRALPVVAYQDHVAARFERRKRSTEVITSGRGRRHVEIIAEHGSPKTQLAAQDLSDPATREARGTVIKTFMDNMCRHDARQIRCDEAFEGHQIGETKILVRAPVDGKCVMRVDRNATMPGKVLSHSCDPGIAHSSEESTGQRGHDIRIMMERTIPDRRAHPAAEIENRGKAEIHSTGAQLHGHQPPPGARGPARALRVPIMEGAVSRRSGKCSKSVAETLHATTFVIDGD